VAYLDKSLAWQKDHLGQIIKNLEAYPVLNDDKYELAHRTYLLGKGGYRRSRTEEFVERLVKAVPSEKAKKKNLVPEAPVVSKEMEFVEVD
jgi:hypothetical protein